MARILLVDDDHDIRELGRALLVHAGHEVIVADGAMAAFERLKDGAIDLLITDANMPGASGFELLSMIKREPGLHTLTIAMLTGRRNRDDVVNAVGGGAHEYIVKPLDPNLFISKIEELLKRRPVGDSWPADGFSGGVPVSYQARAHLPVELRSISPFGATARTAHPLKPGAILEINSEIFDHLGFGPQKMRVFACRQRDFGFEARLTFIENNDRRVAEVRNWIASFSHLKRSGL